MEKIYLSIYRTSYSQGKDGLITDIRTDLLQEGVQDYNIITINLKVAQEATQSLELITHCDWTLTAKTALDAWQLDHLITYQYTRTVDLKTGTKHQKVVYYAVLDGVNGEGIGEN